MSDAAVCTKAEELMLIISGPSGSGKGTLIDILIGRLGCHKSVSVTTRSPRSGEKEGIDYYFISREKFDSLLREGELLEYNIYGTNGYGTPKSELRDAVSSGTRIIFDVDVHGAMNIKKLYPNAKMVFVIPPDAAEQRRRLRDRRTNSEESIEKRMRITHDELPYWREYTCVIVNETGRTEEAADQLIGVMEGKIPDQSGVAELIENYFSEENG